MIDYKEFKELQQLVNNNEQRLDYIEGAYTYFNLGLDGANFDHLLPSAPEDLSSQTIEIGDTVYIEGVATTLDADMIKDIFDSNLVIIDCGSAATSYPTVFLQRQYVDEDSEYVSPRNARFEAFVTYGGKLYEYTMVVAKYDGTSVQGGYISISCKKASTKPIYCHPISIRSSTSATRIICLIFNNTAEAYTKNTFISFVKTFTGRILTNGCFQEEGEGKPVIIGCYMNVTANVIYINGNNLSGGGSAFSDKLEEHVLSNNTVFSDDVNRIN